MAPGTQQSSPPTDPGQGPDRIAGRNGAASVRRELYRNRLIESRLTPNAISLTGFALNVVAAVLVWQTEFFWGCLLYTSPSPRD